MKYVSVLIAAALAMPAAAQEMPMEGPVPTTALVHASSKDNAALDPAMLKLTVNGHESPITSVTPVQPGAAEIAILIDDGLRGSFGVQLKDVNAFINSLPSGTKVLIGYMQNGTVRTTSGFSTDHAAVASTLRVPLASPGESASPYFCLSDFVKKWPSHDHAARFVLMITNGVDPYNGSTSPLNQDSPYVETAQKDAARAGVAVYSIFWNDAGMRGGRFSGQEYLQQVGDATGGALLSGNITPVSFAPFLTEFNKRIRESYIVSFMASGHRENDKTLVPIKLKTSQGGVKLQAPDSVHPGVSE